MAKPEQTSNFHRVGEFHRAFSLPVESQPVVPDDATIRLRLALLLVQRDRGRASQLAHLVPPLAPRSDRRCRHRSRRGKPARGRPRRTQQPRVPGLHAQRQANRDPCREAQPKEHPQSRRK